MDKNLLIKLPKNKHEFIKDIFKKDKEYHAILINGYLFDINNSNELIDTRIQRFVNSCSYIHHVDAPMTEKIGVKKVLKSNTSKLKGQMKETKNSLKKKNLRNKMVNQANLSIKDLEIELNKAHEEYLENVLDKNKKEKYLILADKYKEEFRKVLKNGNYNS